MTWNSIKPMLKIIKNKYFLFYSCKSKHKKEKVGKAKKGKVLFLIPENLGDRLLSVCKTKILTEYREKI